VRAGSVCGGGLGWSVKDRGHWDPNESDLSLFKEDKQATIASGEIYSEWGRCDIDRVTRLLADKSRFGNAGNAMSRSLSVRRRGADPPKDESGRAGGKISEDHRHHRSRCVSSGNGAIGILERRNDVVRPHRAPPHPIIMNHYG